MQLCIFMHIIFIKMHKNEKSSRHLYKKWYDYIRRHNAFGEQRTERMLCLILIMKEWIENTGLFRTEKRYL